MSETPELLSLVLALRPENAEGSVSGWQGRAAHALFLKAVSAVDPALAERLHEGSEARPFTTSSLLGSPRKGDCALRFTGLTAEVSAALLQTCLPGGLLEVGAPVQLDQANFQVASAHTYSEEHPAAGQASYAALAAAGLSAEPPRKLTLRFFSPTGFRSAGRHQPLPLPELVFGSLLERWNAFSPVAFPAEARRYAAECVSISRFDLSSRALPGKEGGLRIGCVGQAEYTALTYDRYWQGVLAALAAFARFAGVGANTTTGSGQCRAL